MTTTDTVNGKLVPLLSEMIANRCVNDGSPDSGNELRSAQTLKRFFAEYGIEGEILSLHPGRGNFLVRIPGSDPAAPKLMFMGHMDVVPAREEHWSFDPFSGSVADGYVHGRGAVDMLNMTSSMAVAVAECAVSGERYPGDLLFLAVADEESSGRFGAQWLVENHWDLVGADYMVTELGGFFLDTADGPGVTVTVGEKGLAWTRITAEGTAGHGSMPYRAENAAVRGAEIVLRLAENAPAPVLTPAYREMARFLAKTSRQQELLQSREGVDAAIAELFAGDPGRAKFLHTASRMTVSPNAVHAGSKVNIIADRAEVLVDVRMLPGQTRDDILGYFRETLGPLAGSCEIELTSFFPSTISRADTPLMEATRKLIRKVYPAVRQVPMFIGGVTDGRFWREKGATVYGFSLFDSDMTMTEYSRMLHGRDERISIRSLERSFSYFRSLPGELYACMPGS